MSPHLRSGKTDLLIGIILIVSICNLPACLATPSPISSAEIHPKTGIAPLDVSFSVNASDPDIRVDWDFGDGTMGSGKLVRHVYTSPGEYSVGIRWVLPGGMSGNRSGFVVRVYDPGNLPGNYTLGNLSPADMLYLSTLQRKIDLFDQYYTEFTYLNKSGGTKMRYTSREFQFAMSQSLSQLESIETSPGLGQVRSSARILFEKATEGAHDEFLAGISLESGDAVKAESYLEQARPKLGVAREERERLIQLLGVFD